MSTQENKVIGRHIVGEIWNKRNLETIDDHLDAGFIYHDPSQPEGLNRDVAHTTAILWASRRLGNR